MRLAMVQPTFVTIGSARWPIFYNLWAVWCLEAHFSPVGDPFKSGLQGFIEAQKRLAVWDINITATFLWAGLLHESPGLTIKDALHLLDQAQPAELVRLPSLILEAIANAVRHPSDGGGGSGDPWSWEVALAIWIKEWGRSEEEFWRATFRTFTSISNGLSKLYEKAREGGRTQAPPEGYGLIDLLSLRGR